ncbi:desmoglein-1-beta-like isoform X2 [Bufo bufo]|uniref:desmoglein-1-beta-like isoform X2 n=1 Tax=Bufo bufo TaxID=8384 RepID=UPI001ABE3AD1|nr:desmoglein-1-beta-like isoform X2 [Bufo bufo]
MDWKLWAPFSAFIILLICSQCSCNWKVQVNKGKDEKGKISWETYHYRRQKREWIAPPTNIEEGVSNTYRNPIAKVHSDIEVKKGTIFYRVFGQGVDQPPYGLFKIDSRTGELSVTEVIVDREEISMLYITVHAVTASGQEVEKPLQLRVRVLDKNDNPPIFSEAVFVGSIEENSKANALVMQIVATDADEENTVNSQVAYRIVSQSPSDPAMFIINRYTGQVFTMSNLLDRESVSAFSLVVSGKDLNGAEGGLSGQCGANIKILDVNDNFPTLEYDVYSVSFKENMVGLTDLRMKVFDLDEMYTDNWIAVFEIVSGNEGGWFAIETDAETNVGILKVVKALDYEAMMAANLAIIVSNRAAYHYSVMSEYQAKVTSINVQVENVREGPAFIPSNYNVQIPSGLSAEALLQYVLTKLTAMDMDTGGPATNVVYSLDQQSSRWFVIDSTTGEIRMTYELIQELMNNNRNNITGGTGNNNGTYTATILATDDTDSTLTGTGTVEVGMSANPSQPTPTACPTFTQERRDICTDNKSVIIKAVQEPLNAPLKITVADNPFWTAKPYNDTAIIMEGINSPAVGNYTVNLSVTDKSNVACGTPIRIGLQVCECTADKICDTANIRSGKNVSLSPAAIGLIILGFLALLLALLLLPLCVCGSGAGAKFVPVAAGYDGAFHQWGTEGAKPEDVDMTSPFITSGGPDYSEVHASNFGQGVGAGVGSVSGTAVRSGRGATSATGIETTTALGDGFDVVGMGGFSGGSNVANSYMGPLPPPYEKSGTMNMAYVENYFAEKAESYANEDESRPANDCLLIYDNEGIGSPAGSVGCCSFIADDLDDTFLDTLGPKFKTLAEICIGSEIDPVSSGHEPRLFPNVPIIETERNVILDDSAYNVPVNRSLPVSSTYITESNLQPARPMVETFMPGNVVVTETYTTSGGTLRPVTRNVDSGHPTNILVTERLVGSNAAPAHGVFPDLQNGSNVIVTERVVRPASGVHEYIELPNFTNLADASNVVVTERVVGPNSARMSNSFNIPDLGNAQNVLVTERVIQPISNVQGNLSIRPEMGSSQNIYVTEKTVRSGPAMKTQMLSAEPLMTQTVGSTSPSLTRSKVTKYSTVQYTNQ